MELSSISHLICIAIVIETTTAIISNSHPTNLIIGDGYQASEGYTELQWGYKTPVSGTQLWPYLYPLSCAGRKQSPIAIKTTDAVNSPYLTSIELFSYDSTQITMKAFNNGHVAKYQIRAIAPSPLPARLRNTQNSVKDLSYEVEEIHLHWGVDNSYGSEHSLDGVYYAAEIHFVHRLNRMTMNEAMNTPRGLAVLAVLVVVGQVDNPAYVPLVAALRQIKYKNSTNTFMFNKTLRKLLPNNMNQFFRYEGSLTTPTCNEVVVWTVFRNPVWLSIRQINEFRKLLKTYENEPPIYMKNNYRPVQPMNQREIFKYGI